MTSLKENLEKLYPGRSEELQTRIIKLISDFKEKNPGIADASGELFSERDVMLICYADHVKEPSVKTLKTMNKFLDEFATVARHLTLGAKRRNERDHRDEPGVEKELRHLGDAANVLGAVSFSRTRDRSSGARIRPVPDQRESN